TADIPSWKQREGVIAAANALIEAQKTPVPAPEGLINPFVGPEEIVAETKEEPPPVAITTALAESELLARLAAQIPASGTANLGGSAILLLGQKRLKVGDVIRLSFEGKSYEVSIAHIG